MKGLQKNQRGSLTLFFLLSCPLLLSASCFVVASFLTLNTYQMVSHSCQKTALKVQKAMAPFLKQILSLNPIATKLHRDHQRHQSLSLLPGPSQALHVALLTKTILQQATLRGRQQLLLLKAHTRAQRILRGSQREINTWFSTNSSLFIHTIFFGEFHTQWSSPALAVTPKLRTITWVAPQYEFRHHFESQQAVTIQWHFRVQTVPGIQWIASWIPVESRLQGTCSSTLRKRGREWIPILKKVNSSLSSSLF